MLVLGLREKIHIAVNSVIRNFLLKIGCRTAINVPAVVDYMIGCWLKIQKNEARLEMIWITIWCLVFLLFLTTDYYKRGSK